MENMKMKTEDLLSTPRALEDGIEIEKLLDRGVVLELDGMSYEDQTLLVLFFFYWIYARY